MRARKVDRIGEALDVLECATCINPSVSSCRGCRLRKYRRANVSNFLGTARDQLADIYKVGDNLAKRVHSYDFDAREWRSARAGRPEQAAS